MRWKVVVLVALGAAVRFLALGHQSYDHDEAVTAVRVIQPSLWDTLHGVSRGERSPPLYYLLAWLWSKPFGVSEAGLRSLSALIGTATVLAAYWAARGFGGRTTGLAAAALFALNPYLIWYSQEARSYALLALAVTLSLGFFIRALDRPSSRNLAWWSLACAFALVSHYFAIFLIAPQAACLLIGSGERRRVLLAVLGIVVVGAALLPLIASQEGTGRRNGFTEISLASRAEDSLVGYAAGEEPTPLAGRTGVDAVQLGAVAMGLALLGCGMYSLAGAPAEQRRRSWPLLATFGFAFLVPLALGYAGPDYVNPRNLIGALVPLLIVIAFGLTWGRSARVALAAVALACSAGVVVLAATYVSGEMERPNFRAAAAALQNPQRRQVVAAIHNADDPLAYYLGARKFDHSTAPRGIRVRALTALSTNYRVQPPPGFREVDLRTAGGVFLVWRFAAPHPKHLDPKALRRVLDERADPLIVDGE